MTAGATLDRPPADLHSLQCDGESVSARLRIRDHDHLLEYRVSGAPVEPRYEPFLVASLPIAMRAARSLSVPEPVSPRLLSALGHSQAILSAWWPDLRPIDVDAEPGVPEHASDRGTASFFSGGVDSFYTALRNRDRLDALVFVHGFDLPLGGRSARARVSSAIRRAAEELERPLIEVETNVRETSDRIVEWVTYHGALLASVGLLLGSRFRRVMVPASFSYRELVPRGSHALLDPLWSTEGVEIVHEGATPRVDKLELVSRSEHAMRWLRVCFERDATYNCGRCPKCLRTMAGLRIVGALERCDTLPHDLSLGELARIPTRTETDVAIMRSHLRAARVRDADPALIAVLSLLHVRGSLFVAVKPARDGPGARWWDRAAAAERHIRGWVRS